MPREANETERTAPAAAAARSAFIRLVMRAPRRVVTLGLLASLAILAPAYFIDNDIWADGLELAAVCLLVSTTILALHLARTGKPIRWVAYVAAFFVIVSQTVDFTDEIPYFADVPLLGPCPFSRFASPFLLGMGVAMLFGAFHLAVVDGGLARARLVGERNRLVDEIRERKRAEEDLRTHQEQLQGLMDVSPTAIGWGDSDGTGRYVNRKFAELFGYTLDETPDMEAWARAVFPDESYRRRMLLRLRRNFRQARLAGGDVAPIEASIVRKDGSTRVIEIAGALLPRGLLAVFNDITQRTRAQEELAAEKAFSETMLTSLPGIFYMYNQNGTLVRWNKNKETITGYSAEELRRFNALDWFSEEDRARVARHIAMVFDEGESRVQAGVIVRGGARIPFDLVGYRLDAPGGPYLIGLGLDITEFVEAQRALRESEERFRVLIENASDAFYLHDMSGRLVDVNQRACDDLGYTRDELLEKGVFDIEVASERQDDKQAIWERLASGAPVTIEGRHRRKDGTTFPVELRLSFLEVAGEPLVLALARDVSARKKLEEQLRQAQRMEAVGRLAGGVAHDFNNALQAILGYGRLALEEAAPGGALREDLEEVVKAANHATMLVRQLLAFSRRQVLRLENLRLDEIVHDLARMIGRVIGEDIVLTIRTSPALHAVRADRGQMEQVLMNLCVNARDAMPGGGEIAIGAENVRVDDAFRQRHPWAQPGDYVLLSVRDTGCGMDADTQERIFEPFFTTKDVGEGTGLGLATVYGIVRQHEGMVDVHSQPGQGSEFRVYLPAAEPAERAPAPKPAPPVAGGTETILLAEDEESVRKVATRLLERAGYTVVAAEDGEEALRIFDARADEIHLAFLDVVMPGLSGWAVAEHIHRSRPGTPILLASGYSADMDGKDLAMEDHMMLILKPYPREALLSNIRQLLDA
ncbi:MAG: PAS domain S-box protein [Candidatus Hydrogenedentes bacterium]|nr:PAS domain S-box protein [Candidatus Hydrogenedentota bacterium]